MVTSPSYSPRKKNLIPKSFCRAPAVHCQYQVQIIQRTVQWLTIVFFRHGCRSRQCLDVALLLVPSPLFLHCTNAWHLADVGDEQQKVRRPVTDASGGFAAARERRGADGATQRRPSHRSSPRGLPLPRTRCHSRREPLGAERALCHRRARAATPSWTGAVTPRPAEISGGTTPVTSTDAAWPLKPPANPLPRRNRSPEILRSRPPRRSAYK